MLASTHSYNVMTFVNFIFVVYFEVFAGSV